MKWVVFFASMLALVGRASAEGGNIQRFDPEPSPLGGYSTGSGDVLRHLDYGVGLNLDYAAGTLVVRDGGGRVSETVSNDFRAHLRGAIGLGDFVELGLILPVALYVAGNDPALVPQSFAVGDAWLQPRFRLLSQWKHGVSLSVSPTLTIPLGGSNAFAGDTSVTVQPEVALSRRFGWGFLAGQAHFRWRPTTSITPGAVLGSELGLRFAGGWDANESLQVLGELDGGLALATLGAGALGNPLELRGGIRYRVKDWLAVDAALGAGLLSAPGTPDYRVVVGFTIGRGLRPPPGTTCTKNGGDELFEAKGTDSDGDGIDDTCDLCVDEAETANGYKDADGCAESDPDNDGVFDENDLCPQRPGPAPSGCGDSDKDGLRDDTDRCIDEPEDKDGRNDDDGCIDADDDGDGVPDVTDQCVLVPEDKDGFEDDNGCPDLDDDSDGIPDTADKCPKEKETINGVDDEDGCPDKGKSLVVVRTEKIEILDRIYFATDQAVIEERSFPLLKQIALTFKAHPEIKRVRVEGHTDDVGGRDHNIDLSQRRAESVVTFLTNEGVDKERMEPKGFASDRPLVQGKTEKARATNRRVEFVIVEPAGDTAAVKEKQP